MAFTAQVVRSPLVQVVAESVPQQVDLAAPSTTNEILSETTQPTQEELQGGGPRVRQWKKI